MTAATARPAAARPAAARPAASRWTTIRARLLAGFTLAALCIAVVGWQLGACTTRLIASTQSSAQASRSLWNLERLVSALEAAEISERDYLATGDPRHLEPYREALAAIPAALARLEGRPPEAAGTPLSPEARRAVRELAKLVTAELAAMRRSVLERQAPGTPAPAAAMGSAAGRFAPGEIRRAAHRLSVAEEARHDQRIAAVAESAARTLATVRYGSLLIFAVMAAFYLALSAAVTRPLRALVEGAGRLGAGDFDHRIAVLRHDEMGELAAAFNRMAASLHAKSAETAEASSRLAAALAANELIFDRSLDVICTFDAEGRFLSASAAGERIWGYRADELIGREHLPLVHPDDRERSAEAAAAVLAGVELRDFENRYLCKDGRTVEVRWSASWSAAEGIVVAIARDMSERRRSEELERINEQLQRRTSDLVARSEEVAAFAYIVSHDLRAPLVNIKGFSAELRASCGQIEDLLRAAPLPAATAAALAPILREEVPAALHYIQASTGKSERLLDALSKLSRTGRQEYRVEPIAVDDLVSATLAEVEQLILASGAEVVRSPLPPARGDATAIGQVFANLITNALKYLQPGRRGRIELGGEARGGECHYWVRDNGAGIPAAAQRRLFQVFQRFHPKLAEGEGIGLAIIKHIVDRHDGRVWVESEEGAGSTFHLTLRGA